MRYTTREWLELAETDLILARELLARGDLRFSNRGIVLAREAAEKYLKSLLIELDLPKPNSHELEVDLLRPLLELERDLFPLADPIIKLDRFSPALRYRPKRMPLGDLQLAITWADEIERCVHAFLAARDA